MARKNADLSSFSVTQQLDTSYWNKLNDGLHKALEQADTHAIASTLVDRLERNGWTVSECYAIIHDKDTRAVWSEAHGEEVIEVKDEHIHVSVKFAPRENVGATLDAIADVIGVESNYIEKPKSGRYSFDNQLAYLIHAKDSDKYQYEPSAVATVRGEGYMSIYTARADAWRKGRAVKKRKEHAQGVDWLEDEVLEGRILREQIFLSDELYRIYASNSKRIDCAFEAYGQRKIYRALDRLKRGEFKTKVFYIMGEPGNGKTSFAKLMINDMIEDAKKTLGETWSVCATASTNPVDDYNGEEILLMDDVRGATMKADDWLKLLDPYNMSPSSARYRNKTVAAHTIVITTCVHPVEFFYYAKGVGGGTAQEEAIDQFLRRLTGLIEVIKLEGVNVSTPIKGEPDERYYIKVDNPFGEVKRGIISTIDLQRSAYYDGLTPREVARDIAQSVVRSAKPCNTVVDGDVKPKLNK